MKKNLILMVLIASLLLISCAAFIYAQAAAANPPAASNFQESTNKILEADIVIPENLQIFSKFLFGLEGTIEVQNLIILLALWVVILLLIQSIIGIIPLFGEGWKSWTAAVIITCLISITGAIQNSAQFFFFGLRNIFSSIGKYGFFFLALNLIILIFFAWGAKKLLVMLKNKARVEMKKQQGFEEGVGI